jgi:hypothetical protein
MILEMSAIWCESCQDSAFIVQHEDMIELSACSCEQDLQELAEWINEP